ncbi:hypothetical protein JL722_4192 [Aureococcus anophagefferens]|nr:hypothetical protein JL722_4192 [Aureococcus anophagefferens]
MAQFGINGNLTKQKRWKSRAIPDEASPVAAPPRASNTRGRLTFAHAGKNTRTTQLFLNFGDNARLDRENFPPFAEVAAALRAAKESEIPHFKGSYLGRDGMAVVDAIHVTGEGAPSGKGPNQGKIQPSRAAPRRRRRSATRPSRTRLRCRASPSRDGGGGAPRAGGGRWYVFLIPALFVLSVFARRYRRRAAPAAAGFDAGDAEDPALSKEN